MSIKRMQYDIKVKLNKVDSNQYRNLRIPEIDWALNEAQEIFIKIVSEPRSSKYLSQKLVELGFQINQRSIDDIRTLVRQGVGLVPDQVNSTEYRYQLPDDYMFFHSAIVLASKGSCEGVQCKMMHQQTDDRFLESPFTQPSFEWREIPFIFYDYGILVYSEANFSLGTVFWSYIKKPVYIHNAEDYSGGQYRLPDGTLLTGFRDSELPEHTHREIADIAVLILSGQLQFPDYQIKKDKLDLLN